MSLDIPSTSTIQYCTVAQQASTKVPFHQQIQAVSRCLPRTIYEDKFYCWAGVQLVIHVMFLGISTLDIATYSKVSNFIIALMCAITGITHPFKSKYQNYQEQLIFLYLQILHVFARCDINVVHVMNTIAAAHFTLNVMYYIDSYLCGGEIRNKIQKGVSSFKGWITNRSRVENFKLGNIPEVTLTIVSTESLW